MSSTIASGFPGGSVVKNPPEMDAGDTGLIPGFKRSPEEGKGNPLQYSCPLKYAQLFTAIIPGEPYELGITDLIFHEWKLRSKSF